MSAEVFAALVAFAFVSSITPGPNNAMLMASGANFGLRRTLPHLSGVVLGFTAMVLVLGAGLAPALMERPRLREAMQVAAIVYVLWLAWKIAHATAPEAGHAGGRPLTFWQAAGFQWVNPKAWAMGLAALSAYAPAGGAGGVAVVAAVFCAVTLPSVWIWVMAGQRLARALAVPGRLVWFNRGLAVLLVVSMLPVMFE